MTPMAPNTVFEASCAKSSAGHRHIVRTPSRFMPKYTRPRPGVWGWLVFTPVIAAFGYALYLYPWVVGVFLAAGVTGTVVLNRNFKRKLSALAALRPNESLCTFARSFNPREVDTWVIRAVYEQLQMYLASDYPQFPVRAEDQLNGCLMNDPDDLDFCLAKEIAARTGRSLENTQDNPYYGSVNTVRDLVLFFNAQPRANKP